MNMTATPTSAPAMTELEGRLAAPDGEETRRALLARLADLHWRLHQRQAASVPRADYRDLAAVAQAVEAAREVLAAHPIART